MFHHQISHSRQPISNVLFHKIFCRLFSINIYVFWNCNNLCHRGPNLVTSCSQQGWKGGMWLAVGLDPLEPLGTESCFLELDFWSPQRKKTHLLTYCLLCGLAHFTQMFFSLLESGKILLPIRTIPSMGTSGMWKRDDSHSYPLFNILGFQRQISLAVGIQFPIQKYDANGTCSCNRTWVNASSLDISNAEVRSWVR